MHTKTLKNVLLQSLNNNQNSNLQSELNKLSHDLIIAKTEALLNSRTGNNWNGNGNGNGGH